MTININFLLTERKGYENWSPEGNPSMIHQILLPNSLRKSWISFRRSRMYMWISLFLPYWRPKFSSNSRKWACLQLTLLWTACAIHMYLGIKGRGEVEAYVVSPPSPYNILSTTALGSGPQSHFAPATQATFLEPKVVLYAEGVHLSRGTVKFRK